MFVICLPAQDDELHCLSFNHRNTVDYDSKYAEKATEKPP